MPIKCQICQQEFKKQITNSHLRKHDMTTLEYKETYGSDSLSCPEYRKQRSEKMSGSANHMFGKKHSEETKSSISSNRSGYTAHNKGAPMSEEQKGVLREKALERNGEWKNNGNHPLLGRKHTDETKAKIKKERAKQIITSEHAQKAAQTRKKRGYAPPMLGKTHSEETKKKILASTQAHRDKIKYETEQRCLTAITSLDLTLLSPIEDHFIHLKCNKCGHEFHRTKQVFDPSRIRSDMCDVCYPKDVKHSKDELEILNFVRSEIPDKTVLHGDRKEIWPLELDIYIPELKIGIEYCGLYWHSDLQGKDKSYHLEKLEMCREKGIRLITVFEDEYLSNPEIVKSRLCNLLGTTPKRIGARQCEIKEITSQEANSFLKQHHIQGSGRSNIRYGLLFDGELVAVMTFSKENISRKITDWELNRFCTKSGFNIIGGASRLMSRFIKEHDPVEIISYADRRWSIGNVYETIGFDFDSFTPANYWYLDGIKRLHRFALRKNKDDDPSLTEWENRKQQGWNRIWDCGNIKYVWKRKGEA